MELKERKSDYEFNHKTDYESTITLELPAGYKVSKLPESFAVSTDAYTIDVSYVQNGNAILYKKRFVMKNGAIKAADFTNWNSAIASIKKIYNEQITLTKI
jgi:hypothetical protein